MPNPSELQAKLKLLRDSYATQLPGKIALLDLSWKQLSQTEWDEAGFQNLYRMAHSLSGSGQTFGFSALSATARAMENFLKPIGELKQVLSEDQLEQVIRFLEELRQASLQRDSVLADQSVLLSYAHYSRMQQLSRHVFIVEDDKELAEELKVQLSYFDYDVSLFHTLNDFRDAIQKTPNVVVLMDVNFPEDSRGGVRIMNELQLGRDMLIPVIFLSAYGDLDIRLDAVRAGCVAYLLKPVNLGILIDKLDDLTTTQPAAAYRVLIVDDMASLTDYYGAVLEEAGMQVMVVNNPMDALKPLFEFAPDLILVDMYMPGCNGMELALVIRQIDAFVGVPIVFLSSESDMDKQLSAIGFGGDDFLTKPIAAQHLVSAVSSRIKRSMVLRSFMVRDSLTGLLNHTAIKDQLSHEMARAKRQGKPLSFAMVDVDHFKNINDSYGHPVGDRVIKSLSRLLKQRLRENDLVGRYGGEEFAVILTDADGSTAVKVMDGIRNDFAQLLHLAENTEFSVTFSCGVADISSYADMSKLADAADKALYKAKHAGRNRVMLAAEHPVKA